MCAKMKTINIYISRDYESRKCEESINTTVEQEERMCNTVKTEISNIYVAWLAQVVDVKLP